MTRPENSTEIAVVLGLIALTLFSFVVFSVDTVGVVVLVLLLAMLGWAVQRRCGQ